ncbi:MAG: histone deacetylase family protein [Candidatus Cyclobacteriaceae bacterium M3_2C_046]
MLKIAWNNLYAHPLPENHRFPMIKYNLIPEQLIYEGTISADNLFAPGPISEADILLTHQANYWQKLKIGQLSSSEIRKTGFPFSPQLVKREISIMQGTLQASQYALQHGIGMNIAGGTHHAFSDKGEGFCLLNDIAITANYLLKHELVDKILVVDLDVHQGNGTAEIFKENNRVFTFSMHGAKNYPLKKEKSDLDIALPDQTGDQHYLHLLEKYLGLLIQQVQPGMIFYQSGVDVLKTDKLGRLGLSLSGCKARDQLVLHSAQSDRIPITVSMGGGYSEKLYHIIEAHANTFRLAQETFF